MQANIVADIERLSDSLTRFLENIKANPDVDANVGQLSKAIADIKVGTLKATMAITDPNFSTT